MNNFTRLKLGTRKITDKIIVNGSEIQGDSISPLLFDVVNMNETIRTMSPR